jgi:hypothetical protein
MPGLVTIRIKGDDEVMRKFRILGTTGRRAAGKKTIDRFHLKLWNEVRTAWNAVRVTGGMFRGVAWPKLQDQYTRKLDGVTVPAWGGVPRMQAQFIGSRKKIGLGWHQTSTAVTWKDGKPIRGRRIMEQNENFGGMVKGKLRHGDVRVKQTDIMMLDTKNMRDDFFFNAKVRDDNKLQLEPSEETLIYAERQNKMRPFMFFTDKDALTFRSIAEVAINEQLKAEGLV